MELLENAGVLMEVEVVAVNTRKYFADVMV